MTGSGDNKIERNKESMGFSNSDAWKVKLSLFLNYFVFGILLNSVGIVILQLINKYNVGETDASLLEAFKDLSIAIFSFGIASFLPKIGYKKAMLIGLGIVTAACIAMALSDGGFLMSRILFACIGISFALIKVSVYSTVGLVTANPNEHASFMSTVEGVFQTGVLLGYWLFGFFMHPPQNASPLYWLNTYWVLAAMTIIAFLLLFITPLNEKSIEVKKDTNAKEDFLNMLLLMKYPLVLLFIFSAFLYVFIEQGIQSWLPTFNNKILQLPEAMSVQVTSILAGAIALGRIFGGFVMKKVHWIYVLTTSLICAALLVVLVMPLSKGIIPGSVTSWGNAPLAAYIFPIIGFFLAPIYPTLCSIVLSKLPKISQSAMAGLIVIFSALGGTIGSRITGFLFQKTGGSDAFYFSLIPMGLLLLIIFPYKKLQDTFKIEAPKENVLG